MKDSLIWSLIAAGHLLDVLLIVDDDPNVGVRMSKDALTKLADEVDWIPKGLNVVRALA